MLIEYDNDSTECNSHDEVKTILNLRNSRNENEFWFYLDTEYSLIPFEDGIQLVEMVYLK